MSSTLSLQAQAEEKKKQAREILDRKKQAEKEAKKQAKQEEKAKLKAEEKAKKQAEKEAKKADKKKDQKKNKINGKKLVSLIESQKLLLVKLGEEGTKEELIEQTQNELSNNLDLLNVYLKQEKKEANNNKTNIEVKDSKH